VITNLASLLSPADEKSFLEHFVSKSRMHVKSGDSRRAESILPQAAIDRLLESDVLPPHSLKLVRANRVIPPVMYRRGDGADRINPRALHSLLPQGVSIVIDGIDEYVPQLARLAGSIERRLGHEVWINSFIGFGPGRAFKPHWDNHDVIILQVRGCKRWRSFGVPDPRPARRHREGEPLPTEIVWEDTMRAGDVLYLPRGEVHEAELETGDSAHLTIAIEPRRGIDFWAWLGEQASSEPTITADLPRHQGDAAMREHEARLKARMHALIDSASLGAYLDRDDARARLRSRVSLGVADRVANDTLVVPALRRRVALDKTSPATEFVTIGGEEFSLSAIARRVLDFLATADAQPLGSIVAALDESADDKLIRDAVCELARLGLVGLESQDDRQPVS
jgi:ribosomal protein L16 Arg81 hydroxylase